MISFLIVFTAVAFFTSGLIFWRKRFYALAESALSLLNGLLNSSLDDEGKQKLLVSKTTKVLKTTLIFILSLLVSFVPALLLILLYEKFNSVDLLNQNGLAILIAGILGSLLPFFIFSYFNRNKKSNYSEISMLLHRMILDNYYVSNVLFKWDRKIYGDHYKKLNDNFVIVSGLARSGTTGLATILSKSNAFHYLKYSNMPFLLAPNLWRNFYNPQKGKAKERSHADKVMIDNQSIEALEEYFYKVQLNDVFIKENELVKHEIEDAIYKNYLEYQYLIQSKRNKSTIYLAKNNNLILRYASLRQKNEVFKAIFLFRDPVEHASSLMQQHIRFGEIHLNDPFALEYMDWLGHHEFGLNHKYFQFVKGYNNIYEDQLTLNYWIEIWINYYEYLLNYVNDTNLILISYADLLLEPHKVMALLAGKFQIKMEAAEVNQFKTSTPSDTSTINSALLKRANDLYTELERYKLN